VLTADQMEMVEREILVPAVHTMKRSRRAFKGVLYAGLMLTNQGPKVLEFNVRFGDPECQVLMMRLKSDLLDLLEGVVDGTLDQVEPVWDPRPSLTVVMAADGYPGTYERGKPISGLDEADAPPDVKVFHAGTTWRSDPQAGREGRVVTDGGRVLNVTAIGDDLERARALAYGAVKKIRFAGAQYRNDIGHHALPKS
jgi:phosphoribosylamine--glycine ligase